MDMSFAFVAANAMPRYSAPASPWDWEARFYWTEEGWIEAALRKAISAAARGVAATVSFIATAAPRAAHA